MAQFLCFTYTHKRLIPQINTFSVSGDNMRMRNSCTILTMNISYNFFVKVFQKFSQYFLFRYDILNLCYKIKMCDRQNNISSEMETISVVGNHH